MWQDIKRSLKKTFIRVLPEVKKAVIKNSKDYFWYYTAQYTQAEVFDKLNNKMSDKANLNKNSPTNQQKLNWDKEDFKDIK